MELLSCYGSRRHHGPKLKVESSGVRMVRVWMREAPMVRFLMFEKFGPCQQEQEKKSSTNLLLNEK